MKSILFLVSFLLSLSAFAQFKIGDVSYGGNGCPNGSASIVMTEERKTISILFDQFKAEAGNTTGKRIDRANCNLRIPLQVEPGYSMALIKVDYRGFSAVPAGGSATFDADYIFAGAKGPKHNKKFNRPGSAEFLISNPIEVQAWSACGKNIMFGINATAIAMTNSQMEQTMMIVDSADINMSNPGIVYSFTSRKCN